MPPTIRPETTAFLNALAAHNSREWFQANKARYEADFKLPVRQVAEAINAGLEDVAPAHVRAQPHKAINRIHRDLRFSKNKLPYHTHAWMGFPLQGASKDAAPALYFGFDTEGWAVGAGLWKPKGPVIRKIRAHIAEHHAEVQAMLAEPRLARDFGGFQGEQLKRVPKPWGADHPAAALLRHKSVHLRHDAPPEQLHADDLVEQILGHFEVLRPVLDFLSDALQRPAAG